VLTRDAILGADDLPKQEVEIPEWGGSVFVRTMTAGERDAYESSMLLNGKPNLANMRAKLVVRTAVDEEGKRLFADADAEALGKKSASAVDKLFGVAQRLNGLTKKDVEELEKNSGRIPPDSSPST